MIYFMQPVGGGPVKIGYSANVEQRRKQLELKYKTPLAVLAVMPGDEKEEREIHEKFAHLRFERTEQFQPAIDIFAFINRPLLVCANPEAIEAMPDMQKPLISIRCRAGFRAWVLSVAAERRITPSQLIEFALMRFAESEKIPLPPLR